MLILSSLSHAGGDVWDTVITGFCHFSVCVRALEGKRLELSTP